MPNVVDNVSIKISMNSAAVSSSGKQIERAIKSVRRNYVELEQQFELLNRRQQKYTEQLRQATVDGNQVAIQAAKDQILSERELAAVKDKLTLSYEKRLAAIDREQAKLAELRAEKAQQIEIDRRMAEQLAQSAANLGITPGPNRSDRRRPQHDRQSDRPVIDPVTGQVHVDAEELRRAAEEAAQAQKRLAANLGVTAGTLQQSNQRSNRNIDVTTGQVTGHAEALKRAAEEAAQAQKRLAANLGIVEGSSNERVRVSSRDVDVVTGALKQRTQELLQAAEEAAKAERQLAANLGITPGPSRNVQRPDGPADTRFDVVSGHSGKELDEIAAKQEQIAREEAEARAAARRGIRDQKQAYIDLVVEATKAAEQAEREARARRDSTREAERVGRRAQRASFLEALDTAAAEGEAVQAERNARLQEGAQFLATYRNRQEQLNAELAEAARLHQINALNARQYEDAVRRINYQHSIGRRLLSGFTVAMSAFVGPVVLAYGAMRTFQSSLRTFAEFEQAEARFRVLTGSVESANAVLADLRELSGSTPITFAGAQQAAATLLQFGVEAQNITRIMRQLGDAVGGNNDRMDKISLAFAQVTAAGRLMGQEYIQLINSGWSPLLSITKRTGETMAEFKKRMEEGKVSADEVAKALERDTSAGGRFAGQMDEIAKTTAGKLQIAQSQIEKTQIALGKLLKPAIDGSLTVFTKLMENLADASNLASGELEKTTGALQQDFLTKIETRKKELEAILSQPGRFPDPAAGRLDPSQVEEYKQAIEEVNALLKVVENEFQLRERLEKGLFITEQEKKNLAEIDEYRKRQPKLSEEDYKLAKLRLEEDLKLAKSQKERLQLEAQFFKEAGFGSIAATDGDGEARRLERQAAKQEQLNEASKRRLALEERIADNIGRQTRAIEDQINQTKNFGDVDAGNLQSLVDSLFDPKQDELSVELQKQNEELQKQAQAALDSSNSLAEFQSKLDNLNVPQAVRDELEELIANSERLARALKAEEFRDLQDNIQLEQDKAKLGEEQARQNQLQRDSNLTAGEAKTFQEAEKQLSTLERLNKLADEIKENTKDPYVKMVEELADLRVLLAEGQITQQQFDKERNRLLLEANKAEANAVDSANSPNATQSGSREALARVAEIQLEAIKQQIKERDRNFLIAKANKDANVKSQQLLNEIRNKPGVIGI